MTLDTRVGFSTHLPRIQGAHTKGPAPRSSSSVCKAHQGSQGVGLSVHFCARAGYQVALEVGGSHIAQVQLRVILTVLLFGGHGFAATVRTWRSTARSQSCMAAGVAGHGLLGPRGAPVVTTSALLTTARGAFYPPCGTISVWRLSVVPRAVRFHVLALAECFFADQSRIETLMCPPVL